MNNALYRQGMNRDMTNPIHRGSPDNSAIKADGSGLNNFMENWRDTYLADPSETTKPRKETSGSTRHFDGSVDELFERYKRIRNTLVDWLFNNKKKDYETKKDASDAVDQYVGLRFDGDLRNKTQPGEFNGSLRDNKGTSQPRKFNSLRDNKDALQYGLDMLDGDGKVSSGDVERIGSLGLGISDFLKNHRNARKQDDWEEVEVTIQPGQSFGQMLLDSGLATDHGLWGSDGDVAYYEKQLRDNGALDSSNSISVGQKFTLRKRQ